MSVLVLVSVFYPYYCQCLTDFVLSCNDENVNK